MKSWTPPAVALIFGATIVTLALVGKNAATQPPGGESLTEAEPEQVVEQEAPAAEENVPEVPTVEATVPLPSMAPGYDVLPDGTPVPELPKSAPTRVKFGVILFEYDGAQAAPGQTSPRSRTKAAAKTLAEQTLELARKDFSEAATKGDRGSTADAGYIPRGVLEPNLEYLLFTLDKGALYPEPIDTPRGYWILRRIQ